jgi:hypothetical protein
MSDEEDYDEEEEEEEDEDESGEEDEEGEEEDEEAVKQRKKDNALKDIDLIRNIFTYIDETSERIAERLAMEEEIVQLRSELEKYKTKELDTKQQRSSALGHLSWEEYEGLDDGQRAVLLEKALNFLAHSDS